MEQLSVLLVCGSGASSGFMAANMRVAAKELGYNLNIVARSDSEIENYIDDIDALVVAPHLRYVINDINDSIEDSKVAVVLLPHACYAALDGEAAVQFLIEQLKEKGKIA